MAHPTPIEWTDATWNCIGGCSIHSPGCTNCYAQALAGTRLAHLPLYAGTTSPSKAGPVFNGHLTQAPYSDPVWSWPLRWKGAKRPKLGPDQRSLIFVGDMSDLLHEKRPFGPVMLVWDIDDILGIRRSSAILAKTKSRSITGSRRAASSIPAAGKLAHFGCLSRNLSRTTMPKRIRRSRAKGWGLPEGAICPEACAPCHGDVLLVLSNG